MKKLQTIIAISILALLLSSCATFQKYAELVLVSPQQTQLDVTAIGARIKPYLSDEAKARLHQFGSALVSTPEKNLADLFALLPVTTGSWTADLAIANIKAVLTLVVGKYGAQNPTTLAYFRGTGNGLLANF